MSAPAARRDLVRRAQAVALSPDPAPSPCVSVCRMHIDNGVCEGCLRTLDEIAGWSAFADADKRAVWRQIAARAAA